MHTFSTRRFLAASPSEVFAAMADPQRLASWWGPAGFSNAFDVFEFRQGGRWVFTMVGPDGARYPNEAVFERIDTDRQVVIAHTVQPLFRLTITLMPGPGGTEVLWEQVFDDAEVAKAIAAIVEPANEQNLDRWARELGLTPGPDATAK